MSRRSRVLPPARVARLGLLDLVLVVAAVFAVWTRTPVGGLGQWAVDQIAGEGSNQPDLIGFFRSEGPPKAWLDAPIPLPPADPAVVDGFPEPWRSAVRHGLPDTLPATTLQRLGPGDAPQAERLLAWLDANWDGDPASTLERAVLDPALRERAIERATAAGEPDPTHFQGHRRYLPEDAAREAAAVVDSVLSLAVVFDLRWPVDGDVRISSGFGERVHPVLRTRKFHNGVDLPVPIGTPIHAAQAGTLIAAREDATSGRYVILEHAGGIRTAYCHLSVLPALSVGSPVERGQWIGDSGNTGRSTGPHLHFVLRVDGTPIDPAPYRRPTSG